MLLQRELFLTSSGTHVSWSNLEFQGVVLALTSLLNTVIELWFLTVARSTARGCVAVRDCGFDNYVPFHCRALYFTRVKEPNTLCVFIFSSLGNCKMGNSTKMQQDWFHPNCRLANQRPSFPVMWSGIWHLPPIKWNYPALINDQLAPERDYSPWNSSLLITCVMFNSARDINCNVSKLYHKWRFMYVWHG